MKKEEIAEFLHTIIKEINTATKIIDQGIIDQEVIDKIADELSQYNQSYPLPPAELMLGDFYMKNYFIQILQLIETKIKNQKQRVQLLNEFLNNFSVFEKEENETQDKVEFWINKCKQYKFYPLKTVFVNKDCNQKKDYVTQLLLRAQENIRSPLLEQDHYDSLYEPSLILHSKRYQQELDTLARAVAPIPIHIIHFYESQANQDFSYGGLPRVTEFFHCYDTDDDNISAENSSPTLSQNALLNSSSNSLNSSLTLFSSSSPRSLSSRASNGSFALEGNCYGGGSGVYGRGKLTKEEILTQANHWNYSKFSIVEITKPLVLNNGQTDSFLTISEQLKKIAQTVRDQCSQENQNNRVTAKKKISRADIICRNEFFSQEEVKPLLSDIAENLKTLFNSQRDIGYYESLIKKSLVDFIYDSKKTISDNQQYLLVSAPINYLIYHLGFNGVVGGERVDTFRIGCIAMDFFSNGIDNWKKLSRKALTYCWQNPTDVNLNPRVSDLIPRNKGC